MMSSLRLRKSASVDVESLRTYAHTYSHRPTEVYPGMFRAILKLAEEWLPTAHPLQSLQHLSTYLRVHLLMLVTGFK